MTSDVVLTSALRTNLLSLQNTQRLIDDTQLKLATGLKVNSALDNPQSFFAAQSLNNRASDLSRLLDGIGQSIRTIEEADNGITALTSLVEQADSIATQALDQLNTVNSNAVGSSDSAEVRALDGDVLVGNITGAQAGDAFTIQAGSATALSVTIDAATTLDSLVAEINDRASTGSNAIEASVTSTGELQLRSTNGEELILTDTGGNFLRDIGLIQGAAATTETYTVGDSLTISLSGAGAIDEFTTLANTNELIFDNAADTLRFTVDGGANNDFAAANTAAANIGGATISELVDYINSSVTGLSASFDDATDSITITAASTVSSFTIGEGATGGAADTIDINGQDAVAATLTFNTSTGAADTTLQNLASDYDNVLSQIDDIVEDASYRGVNLLNGDDLTTYFNEDRSNSLTTDGTDFTANGLGLSAADFSGSTAINSSLTEIRTALESVRNFGSSIANDLAVIQTRRDFTESTINTLEAGADDLTVADQNEEGANLLALQTRQTLGVTSLSLASQSQQAVLRLF